MSNTIEKALLKQKNASENNSNEKNTSNSVPEPQLEINDIAKPDNNSPKSSFEIDLKRLSDNGHISLSGERRQINEEYREIKRKLLANAFGPLAKTLHNPNIIMVTSSRPSEGKTFTATNLALSIAAEQDKTVLLVDADVLKPNVLNTLGLEKRKGLMEYLTGDVNDISEVLYSTNIDKLKIIPAGKSHHLSAIKCMKQLMNLPTAIQTELLFLILPHLSVLTKVQYWPTLPAKRWWWLRKGELR